MVAEDVAVLRLAGVAAPLAAHVGLGRGELLPHDLRRVVEADVVAEALRHLPLAVEAVDPRRLRQQRLRLGEDLAEAVVELPRHLARQLEVLQLVLADRHAVGAVDEDVGGHQHGIGEERRVDVLRLALRLVLVLRHPLQRAHRRHRAEDPGELGVFGNRGLDEDRALLRIEPGGEPAERHVVDPPRHLGRGIVLRHRVEVHDGEDAGMLVLEAHPVLQGAEIVADVQLARRLHAAENPRHLRRRGLLRRRARPAVLPRVHVRLSRPAGPAGAARV